MLTDSPFACAAMAWRAGPGKPGLVLWPAGMAYYEDRRQTVFSGAAKRQAVWCGPREFAQLRDVQLG